MQFLNVSFLEIKPVWSANFTDYAYTHYASISFGIIGRIISRIG